MTSTLERRHVDEVFLPVQPLRPVSIASQEVSPIYDVDRLSQKLDELSFDSSFKISIGSTTITKDNRSYLFEDVDHVDPDQLEMSEYDFENAMDMEDQDLDMYMASAAHARLSRSVTPERLSKVWCIDH